MVSEVDQMRIADLPKYVETAHFSAWRNTWAYRKLGYPYIGYYVRKGDDTVELWAKPDTDLDPFFGALEALNLETAEALAYFVVSRGVHGYLRGTYVLKLEDLLITLDNVEGSILHFVLYKDYKELMLSLPRDTSLVWLIALLRSLAKKKEERGSREYT